MSYANWKEWIDDQTINAALVNGAGRELDDCVIGIGADGSGTGPLYLDGNTLKSYIFGGLVNGYYGKMEAVSDYGAGSAGVNYIHLAYKETSDAGVEGRAAGSVSSVAFSLVFHTTVNTPSGYDGSMVLGYATDAVGDNTWTLLTCHDNFLEFFRGVIAPTFDGRDVSADGVKLDTEKIFTASDTPDELITMPVGDDFADVSTWRHLNDWDGGETVEGWTLPGVADAWVTVTVTLHVLCAVIMDVALAIVYDADDDGPEEAEIKHNKVRVTSAAAEYQTLTLTAAFQLNTNDRPLFPMIWTDVDNATLKSYTISVVRIHQGAGLVTIDK